MPQEFPAIRLVALDLDGTLLNREGHVTPAPAPLCKCCG